jgi:transcriptional regulator with XRE-family HTH domain
MREILDSADSCSKGDFSSDFESAKNESFVEKVYRLYFIEKLTQKQVADRLGVSKSTISRIFQIRNWKARHNTKRRKIDDQEIFQLYFHKGQTQKEIAAILGVSKSTVSRVFRIHGWKVHTLRKRTDIDIDKLHHLYFTERLTHEEIAEKLGVSTRTLSRIFMDLEWQVRGQTKYETVEEKERARRESRERYRAELQELRESLFGTKCRICGADKKERSITLSIHRKDGTEHPKDALWRNWYLESVNPEDWAALCTRCHRGATWLLSMSIGWMQIEPRIGLGKEDRQVELPLPALNDPPSGRYLEIKRSFDGDTRDLVRTIFGEECVFCGLHYRNTKKKLSTHRKDGRLHHKDLFRYEKYFRSLNPENWTTLCTKHHNYVHWAMDNLGMTWDDFEMFQEN